MKLEHSIEIPVFEGDKSVSFDNLPEKVYITKATVEITPERYEETLDFAETDGRRLPTKVLGQDAKSQWAIIDFHTERTFNRIVTDGAQSFDLQMGLGGTWVSISPEGSISSSGSGSAEHFRSGDVFPELKSQKIRVIFSPDGQTLGVAQGSSFDVRSVSILSLPESLSLRLGDEGVPFWEYAGELGVPLETLDFSQVLNSYLKTQDPRGGFYSIPLVISSGTLSRLELSANIEFLHARDEFLDRVQRKTIPQKSLAFTWNDLSDPAEHMVWIPLPESAIITEEGKGASLRLQGNSFLSTRIAQDNVDASGTGNLVSASITGQYSVAQEVVVEDDFTLRAVDIRLTRLSEELRLKIDIRKDADGVPSDVILTSAEVNLEELETGQPEWVNIELPPKDLSAGRRFWLTLLNFDGEAEWMGKPVKVGQPALWYTADGGISWSDYQLNDGRKLAGLFRLRYEPVRYTHPVSMYVRREAVPLVGIQRAGDEDFAVEAEFAQQLRAHLDAAKLTDVTKPGELIQNGDFEDPWDGDIPFGWEVLSGTVTRGLSREGPASILESAGAKLGTPADSVESILSQTVEVTGGLFYSFFFRRRVKLEESPEAIPLPISQVSWLGSDGGEISVDIFPVKNGESFHKFFLEAPTEAQRAMVRFRQPAGGSLVVDSVSLSEVTIVPLAFTAETPGQLELSEMQVLYELPSPVEISIDEIGEGMVEELDVVELGRPVMGAILEPSAEYGLELNGTTTPNLMVTAILPRTGTTLTATADRMGKFAFSRLILDKIINRITVRTTDGRGRDGSATAAIIRDAEPPEIEITSPEDGLITNEDSLDIKGEVFDKVAEGVTVRGRVDVVTITAAKADDDQANVFLTEDAEVKQDAFTKRIGLNRDDGEYQIAVIASDRFGNQATKTISVTLDKTPPSIQILSPGDGDHIGEGTARVRLKVVESLSEGMEVMVNDVKAELLEGVEQDELSYEANISFGSEGRNTIRVTATDRAGNTQTESIVVNVDRTPPIVEIDFPEAGREFTEQELIRNRFFIAVSVKESNLEGQNITVNGKPIAATRVHLSDGEHKFRSSGPLKPQKLGLGVPLKPGQNSIKATAIDRAGHSAEHEISITFLTSPEINHNPVGTAKENEDLLIVADVTEDVGIVSARVYYRTTDTDPYKVIEMKPEAGTTWKCVIPGSEVAVQGLEYYIEVRDELSNISCDVDGPDFPHKVKVIASPIT